MTKNEIKYLIALATDPGHTYLFSSETSLEFFYQSGWIDDNYELTEKGRDKAIELSKRKSKKIKRG